MQAVDSHLHAGDRTIYLHISRMSLGILVHTGSARHKADNVAKVRGHSTTGYKAE